MKAAVTGGTGFLGGNLCLSLVEAGHSVTALRRRGSKAAHLPTKGIRWQDADFADEDALAKLLKGCETLFHCAAMISFRPRNMAAMMKANVDGTEILLRAAEKAGVKTFIFCSSVDAIGMKATGEADEDTEWNWPELGYDNPYARTKYLSQRKVLEYPGKLKRIVINPTFMLGPFDAKPSSGKMILEVASGNGRFCTPGINSFVDVRDVCRGMLSAAKKGKNGRMYILGGHNLTYREAFTLIADILGAPKPLFTIPRFIAVSAGRLASLWGNLRNRDTNLNTVTAKLGYANHAYSSARAVKELGYRISPLRPAIEDAVAWFRTNGYL